MREIKSAIFELPVRIAGMGSMVRSLPGRDRDVKLYEDGDKMLIIYGGRRYGVPFNRVAVIEYEDEMPPLPDDETQPARGRDKKGRFRK